MRLFGQLQNPEIRVYGRFPTVSQQTGPSGRLGGPDPSRSGGSVSGRPRLALQGWGTPRRGLPKGLRDPHSEDDLTGDLPAGDGGTRGRTVLAGGTGCTHACTCVSVRRWRSSREGRVERPRKEALGAAVGRVGEAPGKAGDQQKVQNPRGAERVSDGGGGIGPRGHCAGG